MVAEDICDCGQETVVDEVGVLRWVSTQGVPNIVPGSLEMQVCGCGHWGASVLG